MRTTVLLLLGLAGCPGGSNAGKTLVYALEAPPVPTLDAARCAQDVGLDVTLGFEDSIAVSIDNTGRRAWLAACTLADDGSVTTCGLMSPETELALDGSTITGGTVARVEIDGDCSGADLTLDYTLVVDGPVMDAHVEATWHLDNSFECEQLEAAIIQQSGRGVTGCVVSYDFQATKLADCDLALGTCAYE
ncbi:MAG: hypothetical protein H6736_02785 [Alphaproteobacteria bacterium]|nr:hypothetical protein [Alphaproteobacteria bacterium]MCB9690719.1 hypothetical protein [Alphaproteobacteria bacterium]